MSSADAATLYGLAGANIAIYVLLAYRLAILRTKVAPRPSNLPEAIGILWQALLASFPDLPAGSTLREGLDRARNLGAEVDWQRVESALTTYEGYRYGGHDPSGTDYTEVLNLTSELHRGVGR